MDVRVTCPGRVCLAGEDLDWMGKPAILCAVDLGLTVSVSRSRTEQIEIEAHGAVTARSSYQPSRIGEYDGGVFDHVRAGIVVACGYAETQPPPLSIRVESALPAGAGLSSSAAITSATVAGVLRFLGRSESRESVCAMAHNAEAVQLGTGAGPMDFPSCVFGSVTYVDPSRHTAEQIEPLPFLESAEIVVGDTGLRRRTSDVISWKRKRYAANEPSIIRYEAAATEIVDTIRTLIAERAPVEILGEEVSRCHATLRDDLGVSMPMMDRALGGALLAGAYGGKLTGTGMGGCVFALCSSTALTDVAAAFEAEGLATYVAPPAAQGLNVIQPNLPSCENSTGESAHRRL